MRTAVLLCCCAAVLLCHIITRLLNNSSGQASLPLRLARSHRGFGLVTDSYFGVAELGATEFRIAGFEPVAVVLQRAEYARPRSDDGKSHARLDLSRPV